MTTELALGAAAALVNTARDDVDKPAETLPDIPALDQFLATWQWSGRRDHDEAELAAVRGLRPRLAPFWEVEVDEAVEIDHGLLRDRPRLAPADQARQLRLIPPARDSAGSLPLADRMAVRGQRWR